jgi:hypothetical protein
VATKPATQKAASETESVEAPVLDEAGVDADVFTWEPKGGGEPIVLPSARAAAPKGKTFRFFYELNKRRHDLIAQIMYIMDAAQVSPQVQDQVFDLDDVEIMELVNAWTAAVTGASVGES